MASEIPICSDSPNKNGTFLAMLACGSMDGNVRLRAGQSTIWFVTKYLKTNTNTKAPSHQFQLCYVFCAN